VVDFCQCVTSNCVPECVKTTSSTFRVFHVTYGVVLTFGHILELNDVRLGSLIFVLRNVASARIDLIGVYYWK